MSAVGLVPVLWPAPARVRAFSTTRLGGVGAPPFDSLDLGTATGARAAHVRENVDRLMRAAGLPGPPCWPRQVHGRRVVDAGAALAGAEADAVVTRAPETVCAVRTADCLPVLLCDRAGSVVASAHAGWRGLLAGVLEATVEAMAAPPGRLMAWLGPAIGPRVYEVGDDVRAPFVDADAAAARAFTPSPAGRWLADLYALARLRLAASGVADVHGGGLCTLSDPRRFFSYRRDGDTGRMASGIWLTGSAP